MARPRKIYFAAAMKGDRSNLKINRQIIQGLLQRGYQILTMFVIDEVLDVDRGMPPREIFKRDIRLLNETDVVVADISFPSLGVGFEIAYALLQGKKVLALCRVDRLEKTSALIRGISWKGYKLLVYNSAEEAVSKILDELEKGMRK